MTQIYKVGTATVSNGSATVAGTDTGWVTALVTGGLFTMDGLSVPIESVDAEDELTLALPWPGEDGTGAYAIMRENSAASSVVGLYDRLRQAMITLSLHSIHPDFVGTLAEIEAWADGLTPEDTEKVAARLEEGQPDEYYRWGGTELVGPFPISKTGPAGPAGVGEGGYGLPEGGTTGQVAAKASDDDGDVEWIDPQGDVAGEVHAASAKTTPHDDDEFALVDSQASNVLKKLTWTSLKSRLSAYLVSAGLIREKLTSNRTYYVRTDGGDGNTGLVNTSGGAFLTLPGALSRVAQIDFNGFTVTIQLADGTYTAGGVVPVTVGQADIDDLIIQGNAGAPGNVIISTSGSDCVLANAGTRVKVKDVELRGTSGASCLNALGGVIWFENIRFGTTNLHHVTAAYGGVVLAQGNYAITGGAYTHMSAALCGTIQIYGRTVTITGTPAIANFAQAALLGNLHVGTNTYTGSTTGKRYDVMSNSVINAAGGGASYFPGSIAGSAVTGGQYL